MKFVPSLLLRDMLDAAASNSDIKTIRTFHPGGTQGGHMQTLHVRVLSASVMCRAAIASPHCTPHLREKFQGLAPKVAVQLQAVHAFKRNPSEAIRDERFERVMPYIVGCVANGQSDGYDPSNALHSAIDTMRSMDRPTPPKRTPSVLDRDRVRSQNRGKPREEPGWDDTARYYDRMQKAIAECQRQRQRTR